MTTLLLVYHSQSGRNEALAASLYNGACLQQEANVTLLRCVDVEWQHLRQSDGVIFVGAENFGLPNGMMLDCLARQFYGADQTLAGKPYALVFSTGNSGTGAIRHLQSILGAMGMKECMESTVFHGLLNDDNLKQCEAIGEAFATALALGIY